MKHYQPSATPCPEGVHFALSRKKVFGRGEPLPVAAWAAIDDDALALALGRLTALRDEGTAIEIDGKLLVEHGKVASLCDIEAGRLGLPPRPSFALHVQHDGTIDQPEFRLRHAWRSGGGQPLLGVERTGCWLQAEGRDYLLPDHLFTLIEAIDHFEVEREKGEATRWRAWTAVRDLLPEAPEDGTSVDSYLTSFEILHAGAFSITPKQTRHGLDFDPVLYAPPRKYEPADDGSPATAAYEPRPLLVPAHQAKFAEERFRRDDRCRPRYALDDGVYLVLDPAVEQALTVARRAQLSDAATRQAFARNPRAALERALGDQFDETALEQLFVETSDYSDRVTELGLWQKPVLPWVQMKGANWLPDDDSTLPKAGLRIDGRPVEIAPDEAARLHGAVADAIQAGEASVQGRSADGAPIEIPATPATLDALASLPGARPSKADRQESAEADATDKAEPEVLLIEDNLEALGYARTLKPRVDPGADALPSMVKAKLKPHQESGLAWMKEAWRKGEPGVLLADDMGLGKTLQCLAFLEWIKRCQQLSGQRRPMLVVAPTSLLRNWEQEDETHLRRPGLGTAFRLSGRALRDLRRRGPDDMGLDIDRLRDADWVLTTYETMRNHEMSLAGLRFAVVVFDEIQKIKNPASLVTKAAKTLNADFVLGLTGTPIENRLADIWSIADRVQEGLLGDLKSFSRRYEREDTPPDTLGELRQKISEPRGGQPAFMVRRMKEEQLEGLPEKRIEPLSAEMPPVQADAYRAVLAGARDSQKGKMLEALQAMRRVSLHPHAGDLAETPADDIIQASARWRQTFAALDRIARAGEKALIFLETIALQKDLATLIQRRFGLSDQPMIINGGVSGDRRQQRVNAFQKATPGFDVMILGPRAAGVGLTLTAANHVIHLTRWWNPAVEDQCTDRVFRIGQQKPVTVWLPQAIYPDDPERSFDVQLDKLLQRKRSLSRDMLTPPAGTDQDAADLFRATVG